MTTEQKFNCIFCKDVFDNKEELQVHFRKHADPSFKSTNRFVSDTQASTEKVKENADNMVSCDVCSQMFPTISKAITHKHKVHPDHDAKYFCPWCGKLFTMKHPYNIHIQTSHEKQEQIDNKIFHCDSCDVDFFLATAMLYHNKFFHRQDTDIPEVGTSKKMRLYNQEAILLYYCAFCGEEYENKVNLYKHMSDDHGDENQCPEEVLRCPLCEAIFYHLDAYEIHLSFHSTEDLYSVQNELFAQVLDFSLETVPPMVEKVETKDEEAEGHSQDTDAEASMNTMGIESFLELAMGQTEDSNSEKVKKKKHKKSKKAAITLDEFLSMNQDVFGEGLDFHGVEEVPTQAVAKRFNKNNKRATKAAAAAELEKLKQKGIVVMKVGAKRLPKNVLKKLPIQPPAQNPNKGVNTPNDVLSKLMNQGNSQLKIVKKPASPITKHGTEETIQNKIMEEDNHDQLANANENDASEEKEHAVNENKEDPERSDVKTDDSQLKDTNKLPSSETKESLTIPMAYVKSPADVVNKNARNDEVDEPSTHDDIDEQSSNIISNDTTDQSYKLNVPAVSPKLGQNNIDSFNSRNVGFDETQSDRKESDEAQSDHKGFDSEMHDKSNASDTENMDADCPDKEQITKNNSIENSSQQYKLNRSQKNSPSVSSLSTLKYLSHLTVKPVNQIMNTPSVLTIDKVSDINTESTPQDKCDKQLDQPHLSTDKENDTCPTKPKEAVDKDPTLDALKVLGKNITIKSLSSTPAKRNIEETHSDADGEASDELENQNESTKLKDVTGNKNLTIKKVKVENSEPTPINKVVNSLNSSIKNTQTSKTVNKVITPASESKPTKTCIDVGQNSNIKTNTDILKRLTNITTKPVISQKNVPPNIVKLANTSIKTIKHKQDEIIEISDIDDSDNEVDSKEIERIKPDPVKSLSKHITIKSVNQPAHPALKNIMVENAEEHTDEDDFGDAFHSDDDDDDIPNDFKMCSQKLSNKNIAFKNALKNVNKNVSIKPGVPSPYHKIPEQFQDHDSLHSDVGKDEAESEPDEDKGKVKITEMEEYHSDNDDNFENMDDYDAENDNNPIVESPHDSDNEEPDKDFESEIQSNTVHKTQENIVHNKNTICLNNLKNISKNLTIKSLNSNSGKIQDQLKAPSQESTEVPKSQNKQPPTKQSKQLAKEAPKESAPIATPFKNMGKIINHSASNESMNQNVSVNKEVTVKTFQTKTVIQEITTTVTKTIKTVNQTMKQETKNSSQMNIPMLPQKVQGMRPNLSKNLQGVVIRQSPPTAVRPNNAMVPFRPAGPAVRPSKQIIPLRPGLNTARPTTPRMPSVKPNLPKSSPKQHVIGKPLKFSPSAITSSTVKRSNAEEATGPFSCFKKAKESLIPGADMSALAGGEPMVQMHTASHTSTSNYTSTSKMVKGNKVVTATQMKSEVRSMQQLSKLNSLGIKVKSSHINQTQVNQTQVQEKSEPSGMKQTTLDAIQRLQKQGLLIKKPRVEYSDSNHGEDNVNEDNIGYSSTEEHDE